MNSVNRSKLHRKSVKINKIRHMPKNESVKVHNQNIIDHRFFKKNKAINWVIIDTSKFYL
ncbi:hypothetical protein BpHYR1_028504 [Brachionus plicatilis]|uniref:Uncharacterized protein n=1 Tax=Brachionus plicatilis TaxID=10195 RepID=A0A3M7QHM6_BRAPC|nr:hypothetical protein BpHYR1_028504 [Brachionus plicatilis]